MSRTPTRKATRPFGRRPNSTKSKPLQSSVPYPAEQAGQSSGYQGGTDDLDQGLSVTLTNKDMVHDTGVVGMWIDSRNLDLLTDKATEERLHPRQERLVEDSNQKPWWQTLAVLVISGGVAIGISTWAMVVEARADQCSDMSVEYVDCLDMEMQQQQLRADVDQLRQDLEELKSDAQPVDLDEVFGGDE